jgi:polysaccharide pyruvyl transferase WcaK-like protein
MGDEAMLQAATNVLRGGGWMVDIGSAFSRPSWQHIEGVRRAVDLRRERHDSASLLTTLAGYEHVLVIGADVMDGYYSDNRSTWRTELADAAGRVARHAAVVGFSFCEAPTPDSIAALRSLGPRVALWSRDPVSRDRLVRYLSRPVGLSADIAFLLEPRDPAGTVTRDIEWIESQRSQGPVVGINLAKTAFLDQIHEGLAYESLVERFASETKAILDAHPTASVVLIPHDWRTDRSDLALGQLLEAAVIGLDPGSRDRLRLVAPDPPSATALKLVASRTSVVVSSRMHLTIAALGTGTPAATLAYQGKTEGLFQHFPGLGDWSIDPRQALLPGTLATWVARLLDREAELRPIVAAALPAVRELASRNLPVATGRRHSP